VIAAVPGVSAPWGSGCCSGPDEQPTAANSNASPHAALFTRRM
jgi:hypothetical protein